MAMLATSLILLVSDYYIHRPCSDSYYLTILCNSFTADFNSLTAENPYSALAPKGLFYKNLAREKRIRQVPRFGLLPRPVQLRRQVDSIASCLDNWVHPTSRN